MAWGDWYYRQLTRDSLVAAKLCYVQAEFLMGKAPAVRTVNRWETDTVNGLMSKSTSRPALEQFEQNLAFSLADFPADAEAPPARKSVVEGKRVAVRVDLGGRRIIKKKKQSKSHQLDIQ